jgi:hypothetical protein
MVAKGDAESVGRLGGRVWPDQKRPCGGAQAAKNARAQKRAPRGPSQIHFDGRPVSLPLAFVSHGSNLPVKEEKYYSAILKFTYAIDMAVFGLAGCQYEKHEDGQNSVGNRG